MDLISAVRQALKFGGEAGVKAGELAAEAWAPWLKLPIINWLWKNILEHFTDALIKAIMDKSTEIIVPIINTYAASAADKASEELKKVIEDKNATQAQLEAEIERWEKKYEDLVRMRRATPD